jgi:hypothetical protein
MEHKRSTDGSGNVFQWCDADRAMVLDAVTGERQRMEGGTSIGTFEMAMKLVESRRGWEERLVVVKLQAVVAFKV